MTWMDCLHLFPRQLRKTHKTTQIFKHIKTAHGTNCSIVIPHSKQSTTNILIPLLISALFSTNDMISGYVLSSFSFFFFHLLFCLIPPSRDKGVITSLQGALFFFFFFFSLLCCLFPWCGDCPGLTETGCCCWVVSTEIIDTEAKRLPPGNKLVYYDFSTQVILIFRGSGYEEFTSKQTR